MNYTSCNWGARYNQHWRWRLFLGGSRYKFRHRRGPFCRQRCIRCTQIGLRFRSSDCSSTLYPGQLCRRRSFRQLCLHRFHFFRALFGLVDRKLLIFPASVLCFGCSCKPSCSPQVVGITSVGIRWCWCWCCGWGQQRGHLRRSASVCCRLLRCARVDRRCRQHGRL